MKNVEGNELRAILQDIIDTETELRGQIDNLNLVLNCLYYSNSNSDNERQEEILKNINLSSSVSNSDDYVDIKEREKNRLDLGNYDVGSSSTKISLDSCSPRRKLNTNYIDFGSNTDEIKKLSDKEIKDREEIRKSFKNFIDEGASAESLEEPVPNRDRSNLGNYIEDNGSETSDASSLSEDEIIRRIIKRSDLISEFDGDIDISNAEDALDNNDIKKRENNRKRIKEGLDVSSFSDEGVSVEVDKTLDSSEIKKRDKNRKEKEVFDIGVSTESGSKLSPVEISNREFSRKDLDSSVELFSSESDALGLTNEEINEYEEHRKKIKLGF